LAYNLASTWLNTVGTSAIAFKQLLKMLLNSVALALIEHLEPHPIPIEVKINHLVPPGVCLRLSML